ncbi:hypothetical protein C0995_012986 [Termitomyces sp. Mi166|nr:hypothetical protein C0995_012986 [Termitomyces sp. Mi166\
MRPDLRRKVDARRLKLPELANWIAKVMELDEELAEDRAQTQAMIDASNTEQSSKRKPLVERISKPPSRILSASPMTSGANTPRLKLAKLMDEEKKLLSEHQGCTRCCTFYCDHAGNPDACPMKVTNTWPDPKTTTKLTLAMALAAKPKNIAGLAYMEPAGDDEMRDKDTDESYTYAITSSSDTEAPLSAPHMTTMLEHLVLDIEANTATDKQTGFDIVHPYNHPYSPSLTPNSTPDPPKKCGAGLACAESMHREDYASPSQIMALIWEHIESLSLEETLSQKDAEAKQTYQDRFLSELPKTTNDVPNHIFHRIWLKNPSKIVNARGYSTPKKFHEPWKKLLDEHLAMGQLRPSSSEFASPAFCIPKHRDGVPDFTVPP